MRQFKDTSGQAWEVAITVGGVKRARDLLKLDITALTEDGAKKLGALLADPVALVDLLYVLCQRQADERRINDEAFGELFSGEVLLAATDVLVEEIVDFFPEKRKALRDLLAKAKTVGRMLLEKAEREIEAIDPQSLADKFGASFIPAPVSSESTHTPERSAS